MTTPTWLLRAGTWPTRVPDVSPSATGKPLLGLGAIAGDLEWARWLASTAGEATRAPPPPFASVLSERPDRTFSGNSSTLDDCILHAIRDDTVRAVHLHALEVGFSEHLRVAQVVTTLHRGGAERVAIDLHRHVGESTLFVLEPPRRDAYAAPAGTIAIHEHARGRDARMLDLTMRCIQGGFDVVHAHLLAHADVRHLSAAGLAVVTTLHNVRHAWPSGMADLEAHDARLVVACAIDLEREAKEVFGPKIPLRTAWNGVVATPNPSSRAETRRALGVAADTIVALTVANPRTQKRLTLAAEAIARLAETRKVVWVIAGAPLPGNDDARTATEALDRAVSSHGIVHLVRRLGSVEGTRALLGAADVALSTSAWEGFSLAYLEALVAGVPLVTTRVSGTSELEALATGVHVVANDAPATEIAEAIARAVDARTPATLSTALALPVTAARHEALYLRVAAPRGRRDGPLWIITNNFSIGGAQASAQRLVLGLRARGADVRVAVLEEQRAFPTPWRAELERAGVPVIVADSTDTARACEAILDAIDHAGASAVVFWNAIAEHKIRLADALLDVPVFDVSPGEMYFTSLDRYFAKPRAELPYRTPLAYGKRLSGVVVKFAAERDRARSTLGAHVHVIRNGVPTRDRPPRSDRTAPIRVGTLARISPDKKLEILVDASVHARTLTTRPFVIEVAGPVERGHEAYAAELARLAEGTPLRFVGSADRAAFLDDLDLFALVAEPAGCPNASLEAMAVGLAVVATDAGGMSEQVDARTGILVPRWDSRALAEAIAALVDDSARREHLGRGGRAKIEAEFSIETMIERYAALFGGALNRSASGP
ncbi:hypothetical protein BH09MYX1_BH09MYX1_11770 [soil metagenome]